MAKRRKKPIAKAKSEAITITEGDLFPKKGKGRPVVGEVIVEVPFGYKGDVID